MVLVSVRWLTTHSCSEPGCALYAACCFALRFCFVPTLVGDAFGVRYGYLNRVFFNGLLGLPICREYLGPRWSRAAELGKPAPLLTPVAAYRRGLCLLRGSNGSKLLYGRAPVWANAHVRRAVWEADGIDHVKALPCPCSSRVFRARGAQLARSFPFVCSTYDAEQQRGAVARCRRSDVVAAHPMLGAGIPCGRPACVALRHLQLALNRGPLLFWLEHITVLALCF